MDITVPSLLKRWKRLRDGLEVSSKAYKALSEHFESKTAQWLEEDKQAQEDRKQIHHQWIYMTR
jgi:post-segregation antitoxin (ccd killing protein)